MAEERTKTYNEPKYITDYGDQLFECGDLFCTYPLLSVERTDEYAKFEYPTYYVTVYYSTDGNKRTYERWERTYKEIDADDQRNNS